MRQTLRMIRDAVTPRGAAPRSLRFGLAAGSRAVIDFKLDTSFYFGLYERELNPHYRRLVRGGVRCFDVGGYRGWSALEMSRLGAASVVVFESNPANVAAIRASAALNPYDIRVVQGLVGNRPDPGWMSLDAAAKEHGAPDFIKMDIEGGEAEALEGAGGILSQRGPAMIIETHGEAVENRCLEILASHGYKPAIVGQRGGVVRETRGQEDNRWIVCEQRGVKG